MLAPKKKSDDAVPSWLVLGPLKSDGPEAPPGHALCHFLKEALSILVMSGQSRSHDGLPLGKRHVGIHRDGLHILLCGGALSHLHTSSQVATLLPLQSRVLGIHSSI